MTKFDNCRINLFLILMVIILLAGSGCEEAERKACESECRAEYNSCMENATSTIEEEQCKLALTQCSAGCVTLPANLIGPEDVDSLTGVEGEERKVFSDTVSVVAGDTMPSQSVDIEQ